MKTYKWMMGLSLAMLAVAAVGVPGPERLALEETAELTGGGQPACKFGCHQDWKWWRISKSLMGVVTDEFREYSTTQTFNSSYAATTPLSTASRISGTRFYTLYVGATDDCAPAPLAGRVTLSEVFTATITTGTEPGNKCCATPGGGGENLLGGGGEECDLKK